MKLDKPDKTGERIEKERKEFTQLISANPNYFGNVPGQNNVVKKMVANTKYEEIHCLGFNPDTDRLEATIHLKLPVGYGGSLCHDGTMEYVRFYIDYGSGWEDVGVAAVNVHDIPNAADCAKAPNKPLSYVVTQRIDSRRKACKSPVLPRVRAILSWNLLPDANKPDWPPIWGNVIERHIQIKPRFWEIVDIAEILTKKTMVPPVLEKYKYEPLPLPDPPPFTLAELSELYLPPKQAAVEYKPSVEAHRFGLAEIEQALSMKCIGQDSLASKAVEWKKLNLDFAKSVAALVVTKGNVSYEELECVGLDYNMEQLVATFRVKKPQGYSGGLCSPGSKEYIAFWADWENKCEWDYLDTVEVKVHDISPLPDGGLHYSVFLPVDFSKIRRVCTQPKIGRVRAVLSWNSPPSTSDPDKIPYWGNRLDTHVQIRPGKPVVGIVPQFHRIGGIRDDDISNTTGLTLPTATFDNGFSADNLGRPCPFAERVVVTGLPFPGHQYRVQVRRVGDPGWTSLVNTIQVQPLTGPTYSKSPVFPTDYWTYELLGNNPDMILAWWHTSGDELWEVKLDILGQPGHVIQRIRLKNSGIEDARIHIASMGDCGKFLVGDVLDGAFVARDPYFGHYTLQTMPFAAPAGQLAPTGGTVQTPSAPPEPAPPPGGTPWQLDTKGMKPCGYVLHLGVWDRAIRRSVPLRHYASRSVGFCLEKKTK
jgi:hypothetical protein